MERGHRPVPPRRLGPRADDVPLWERHLRLLWNLGDDEIELAVESVQVNPALALAPALHRRARRRLRGRLMSYGPTRTRSTRWSAPGVRRLLHLDLVPGLQPLLLTEFGVAPELVPTEAFLKVLGELADAATEDDGQTSPAGERPALLLGQYLSALGILTAEEEEELHAADDARRRGARAPPVVFKPHPAAPGALVAGAGGRGRRSSAPSSPCWTGPVLAEVLFQRTAARAGRRLLLHRRCSPRRAVRDAGRPGRHRRCCWTGSRPYQNSNRVPADHRRRAAARPGGPAAVAEWAMPTRKRAADADRAGQGGRLRHAAEDLPARCARRPSSTSSAHLDAHTWRYFKRRRLTSLALPGGVPAQLAFIPRNATVRRIARRARALGKTVKK